MSRLVDQPLDELPDELRERETLWRRRLEEWEDSGEAMSAFCRARGIPEGSMYNWRRELARRDRVRAEARDGVRAALTFVPLTVRGEEPDGDVRPQVDRLEIVLETGRRILVPDNFDMAVLGKLVRLLETLPC